MKKFFVMLVACVLSTSAFAGSSLAVKSGTSAVLKENANVTLEIDYSKTMVESKTLDEYLASRGEDFVRDWPQDKVKAQAYFVNRFNSKSKGLHILGTEDGAKYKMTIHVASLDMGNAGSQFAPFAGMKAGGCIMNGSIDIVDLETGEIVCSLSVDSVKGTGHVSETVRIGMMYFQLATDLTKLK